MPDFEYFRASTLDEALKLIGKLDARLKAGGTDLIPQMKRSGINFKSIVDISGIISLENIIENEEDISIGPLSTHNDLIKSDIVGKFAPVLARAASMMAGPQIRNMGTIGGNICNASPAGDLIPGLIVLKAQFQITGNGRTRIVPAEDFFQGPGKTVLFRGEILTDIIVPKSGTDSAAVYLKHGRRNAMEIAQVGVACMIKFVGKITDARIALGAVAPTPIRAYVAENILIGSDGSKEVIAEAAKAARNACKPITDVRTTAEYRQEIVEVLTRRAISSALKESKS